MKESLSNTKKKTIGGWDAPCEAIDYEKLMETARQQCDSLRCRLSELNHSRLQPGETELARRRTVRILTDMYYEQKSNLKLFQLRAEKTAGHGASPSSQKAGEAKQIASPALSTDSKKNPAPAGRTKCSSFAPLSASAEKAARLAESLTSQMPYQQSKWLLQCCLRQQGGRQRRR